MRRPLIAALTLSAASLTLGGCDWIRGMNGGAGDSADTQMRSVEILPGTASDEMILLDQASGDGTTIDAAPDAAAPRGAAAEAEATDGAAAETPAAGETPDAGADETIRPPAGGAEPDRPTG